MKKISAEKMQKILRRCGVFCTKFIEFEKGVLLVSNDWIGNLSWTNLKDTFDYIRERDDGYIEYVLLTPTDTVYMYAKNEYPIGGSLNCIYIIGNIDTDDNKENTEMLKRGM